MERAKENNWPLSVGGFEDQPPPVAVASNCKVCDHEILGAIDGYRIAGQMPEKLSGCTCQSVWEKEQIL